MLVPVGVVASVRISGVSGASSRTCAPRDSLRASAETIVALATSIRLSSSSASTRAVFQTCDLSLISVLATAFSISTIFATPFDQHVLEAEDAAVLLHRALQFEAGFVDVGAAGLRIEAIQARQRASAKFAGSP
jgi:hypothetical protein